MSRERLQEKNEAIVRLQDVFERHRIRAVGFDLDDTLVDTRDLFLTKITAACGHLAQSRDQQKLYILEKEFEDILLSLRKEFGIHPIIMDVATQIFAKKLNSSQIQIEKALEEMHSIYTTCPSLYPGTIETVDAINSTKADTYLMTHASAEWTQIKCDYSGLGVRFKEKVCFSLEEPKGPQWENNIKKLGYDPQEFLVIGDNYYSDIQPAAKIGCWAVWVNNGRFQAKHSPGGAKDEEIDRSKILEVTQISETVAALAHL